MKPALTTIGTDLCRLYSICSPRLKFYLYHNLIKVNYLKSKDRYKYVLTAKGNFLLDVIVDSPHLAIEKALKRHKQLSFNWIESVLGLYDNLFETEEIMNSLVKSNYIEEISKHRYTLK